MVKARPSPGVRDLSCSLFAGKRQRLASALGAVFRRRERLEPPEQRASMAHVRQSRPYSGLGVQAKIPKTISVVPFLLSGTSPARAGAYFEDEIEPPKHPGGSRPPSSKLGTHKPFRARFRLQLAPFSERNS